MAKKPPRKQGAGAKQAAHLQASRNLFRVKIGNKWHDYDPLETLIAFESHPSFDWLKDPVLAAEDSKRGRAALARTMQAVEDVFGLKGLREGGLTIHERYRIISEFAAYCELQKKSSEPSPISSPTPESPPSDSAEPLPLGSTSTASESPCESPSPSVLVSDTP